MNRLSTTILIGVLISMYSTTIFAAGGEVSLKENRSEFSTNMSIQEFNKYYWYKEELQKICKRYQISSNGTKATLKSRIEGVLLGGTREFCDDESTDFQVDIRDEKLDLNIDINSKDYSKLNVKIINGFKFSPEWRIFCGTVLGEKNFKFTKAMAATVRKVKKEKNKNFTVMDLLKIYKIGKQCKSTKIYPFDFMQPEEQTYQWNNFVRDFNQDSRSKFFKDKMKVAALLWRKVRDNPGEKRYRSSLIDEYISKINDLREGNILE